MWEVAFAKNALKDLKYLKDAKLEKKAKHLIDILVEDPFQCPPSFEKLVGDLNGYYSRRINIKHRLIYSIDKDKKRIVIASMWNHYDK